MLILEDHVNTCVAEALEGGDGRAKAAELLATVGRFVRSVRPKMDAIRARLFLVSIVALALAWPAGAALAHEEEEQVPARTLVKQAIALLRGQPEQVEAIEDKIHDALAAEDTEGVDLELVERADRAFEEGKIHLAQDLLEEAIGAAPHRVVATPNPEPGMPAPSPEPEAEPSPVLHERALRGGLRAPTGVAGPVLLGLAGLAVLLGLIVVRRVR